MAFRRTRIVGSMAVALSLALAVGGCGGGDDPGLLPADSSAELLGLLDQAEKQFDDRSCDELQTTLKELDSATDRLPDAEVSSRLRTTINAEVAELTEMAAKCRPPVEEVVPEPVPPAPAPTVAPETTAPPVEPTTTEEAPTTEEEEPPPEPKPPPEPPEPPPEPPPEEPPVEPPPEDPCAGGEPRC